MANTINTFIIYAREDKDIKNRIVSYLNPFRTPFNLVIWHDDNIDPGQLWQQKIKDNLEQTDLFLLLVSIDFMNSDFITKVECKYAIDMHKTNKAVVIPIIIKPCPWDIDIDLGPYAFNLSELQVLPDEAKPIADWNSSDNAYNNIANGIRKFLKDIIDRRKRAQLVIEENKKQEDELRLKNESEERLKKEAEVNRMEAEYQNRLNDANEKYNSGYFENALILFTKLSAERPEANDISDKIKQTKEKISKEEYEWKEACNSGDIRTVQEFQKRYPVSKYIVDADSLIEKLQYEKKAELQEQIPGELAESRKIVPYKTVFFSLFKKYPFIISTVLFLSLLIVVIMKFSGGNSPQEIFRQENSQYSGLEEKEWNAAVKQNDLYSYRLYQYRFPNGKHYKDAQKRINSLNQIFKK